MNKKYLTILIILIIVFVGVFLLSRKIFPTKEEFHIGEHVFYVELADTPDKRYQGLSGREHLGEKEGMLFVFDDYQVRNFIMREMNFPLDIIWLRDSEVIGCEQNIPIRDEQGNYTLVRSPVPVNQVLEVNAGSCEEMNIQFDRTAK